MDFCLFEEQDLTPETEWLSLIEYRNKYNVSLSTLRRRIKEDAIKFQKLRGKYFVFDEPIESRAEGTTYIEAKIKEHFVENEIEGEEPPAPVDASIQSMPATTETIQSPSSETMTLLAEIKDAYRMILKEKEEQIFLLKEEIVNQQMLISLLEEENARLRH